MEEEATFAKTQFLLRESKPESVSVKHECFFPPHNEVAHYVTAPRLLGPACG